MNYFSKAIAALGLVSATYIFSPQQADAQQKYHTKNIFYIDGTFAVGKDGRNRNITHDFYSAKRDFEREIQKKKSELESKPIRLPVNIKVFIRR